MGKIIFHNKGIRWNLFGICSLGQHWAVHARTLGRRENENLRQRMQQGFSAQLSDKSLSFPKTVPNGHKTWKSWPNRCRSSQRRHAISDVYEFLQGNGCTFPVSFDSKWSFLGAAAQWSSIEAGQGAARWWKWCGKPPGGVWWSKFTTSLLLKAAFVCISHDYIPIHLIYSDITLVAIYPIKYRYHILWYLPFSVA